MDRRKKGILFNAHPLFTLAMQIPLMAGLLGASSIQNALKSAMLTPERLISAPRPGAAVVNPSGSRALIGVKAYSFDREKWDETLYHVAIPSTTEEIKQADAAMSGPLAVAKGVSKGFWLSDDVAAYINATSNTLFVKQMTVTDSDVQQSASSSSWTEIGSFPTSVEAIQVARGEDGSATSLVFAAQVYGDGNIHAVKSHDESEKVQEWKRVKGESQHHNYLYLTDAKYLDVSSQSTTRRSSDTGTNGSTPASGRSSLPLMSRRASQGLAPGLWMDISGI